MPMSCCWTQFINKSVYLEGGQGPYGGMQVAVVNADAWHRGEEEERKKTRMKDRKIDGKIDREI